MSSSITLFPPSSKEHKKLEAVADALTKKSPLGRKYYVGETFFDFGLNWSWTTILGTGGITGSYQALCPKDQEEIIFGDYTPEEMADRILSSRFCPDRIREEVR